MTFRVHNKERNQRPTAATQKHHGKTWGADEEVKHTQGSPEHRFLPLKSLLAITCDSGKGVCVQSSKVFFKQVHCAC